MTQITRAKALCSFSVRRHLLDSLLRRILTTRIDYFWDACYQAFVYWTTSTLSDDPFTIARITGVFKAVQSAGTAGAYGMDARLTPLLNEHLASWTLCLVSFIPAAFVIYGIKDQDVTEGDREVASMEDIEDSKDSDAVAGMSVVAQQD